MSGLSIGRRGFLASAGALILGARGASAQAAKPFSLGTFGGIFETALKEMAPRIADQLGLRLDLAVGSGQVTGAKLQAGQGRNPPFAAVFMTPDLLKVHCERGLLRPVTEREVPNLPKVQPRLLELHKAEGGYAGLPMSWMAQGILWRRDLVPFEITSWKDLWRPELRNRVSMQTLNALGGGLTLVAASTVHGGGPQDLEPGWKALVALKPNVRDYFTITSNAITSLVAGDTWASVNILNAGLPLAAKGVALAVPSEGLIFSPLSFGVAKGGDEQSAFRFINFMLEDAQQVQWSKTALVAPSTTVTVPPDLQARLVESDALLARLMPIDFGYLGANMPQISERARRELTN